MRQPKGFTAAELEEKERNNDSLVQTEIATNVRIQACDVEKHQWPLYDILDGKKTTVLALALPGYDIKRMNVELEDGTLSVSVYDDSCKENFTTVHGLYEMKRHGIQTGAFARVFDVDPECEVSRMWKEDGVLFIELCKL
jgi:HSP20 family molecular chaperone IbpA